MAAAILADWVGPSAVSTAPATAAAGKAPACSNPLSLGTAAPGLSAPS